MTKRILIVQTILPHYRKSFFEKVSSNENYEIFVLAGLKKNKVKPLESNNKNINQSLTNLNFKIKGHRFIFQIGIIRFILKKRITEIVFEGPDIHIISSMLLFPILKYFTTIKINWWTQGLNKNSKLVKKLQIFILNNSNSVLTYENKGRKTIIEETKLPKKRVTTLKNAIIDEDYGFNTSSKIVTKRKRNKTLSILFSGRIVEAKRCDILIEALSKLNIEGFDFVCSIVGSGEGMEKCISLAKKLNLSDKICFHGAMYGKSLVEIFSNSDIFILPGKVGLSIIHALSYGLPVITSNSDIHSPEVEVIKKGINGDFYEGLDFISLAEKIKQWNLLIQNKQESISLACKESIINNGYTSHAMSQKFISHFA